ncbi:MAG: hypothetical protein JW730_18420 [Anaerolineales bacterium]|nr:hypothetical protein [Anaerolineales bacterium]
MKTIDLKCARCNVLDEDLLRLVGKLITLKAMRWKGSIELRLDGSGQIASANYKEYEEFPRLTKPG